MNDEVLGALLEKLADRLVDRIVAGVVQRLQGVGNGFIDQTTSPLGPRRHIEAIRSGKLPGAIIGRQYIARAADVDAFVRTSSVDVSPDETTNELDALAHELGFQKLGKGDQ